MNKKDYVLFARLLRRTNPLNKQLFKGTPTYGYAASLEQHTCIIAGVAGIFKADNPNFDENKFLAEITHGR